MCIAILNTKKAGRLPKTQIQNSWDNNDMGAGLLWSKDNKLNVFKSYVYDEYLEKYNEIRDDHTIGNIVLHFRIATSGYNGEHNLHPFLLNDDLGFVHNGVITGLGNKAFSDTYEFNDMLKKFNHNFLACEMTKYFISEYIGYSKLIFLDSKDKYTIINEEKGKWIDGNWYSNDSYKDYNNFYYYGNTKVTRPFATTPVTKTVTPAAKTTKRGKNKTYDNTPKETKVVKDWNSYYEDVWDRELVEKEEEVLVDEGDIYEYLCDLYGLDMNAEDTFKEMTVYMSLNNASSLTELYEIVTDDYLS